MSILSQLTTALTSGSVEVVDLTAPLSSETPLLELPPHFGQTAQFQLEEISRYDDRGPAWYWNNFRTGEHTGTHFDAPNHWVTGKDLDDVASVPVRFFVRPAAVIDVVERVEADPNFLIEREHIDAFVAEHGPLPEGGWLLCRTGWSVRVTQEEMINNTETGPTSPGMSSECARWVAEESPLQGIGVETVGTDAGAAHSFDPMFPCHAFLMGANKYGLAQLENLNQLPPTGAVIIASPLKIVGGSGSPVRVLALVERFYDPDAGVIRLDGRDVRSFPREELRAQLSLLRIHRPDEHESGRVLDRHPVALDGRTALGGGVEQQVDQLVVLKVDLVDVEDPAVRAREESGFVLDLPVGEGPLEVQGAEHAVFGGADRQFDQADGAGDRLGIAEGPVRRCRRGIGRVDRETVGRKDIDGWEHRGQRPDRRRLGGALLPADEDATDLRGDGREDQRETHVVQPGTVGGGHLASEDGCEGVLQRHVRLPLSARIGARP